MQLRFFLPSLLLIALPPVVNAEDFDALPNYEPTALGEMSMQSVGSDSMARILARWTTQFKTYHPELTIRLLSHGSAAAPAALVDGSADLGPMARPMKSAEIANFRKKYGFEPTRVRTAIAGAAVYLPESNPMTSISMSQLRQIFGAQQGKSALWRDLGMTSDLGKQSVQVFGMKDNPYVTSYFRQRVLLQNPFRDDMQFTAGNRALFEALSMNSNSIAFGPLTEAPKGIKIIPVSADDAARPVMPSAANIETGAYPLGRFLNIYVTMGPEESLEPATREFLRFILSKNGQEMLLAEGLLPLSKAVVEEEIAKIQ